MQGRSFGSVAETYDAVRPSYPEEAATFITGTIPCVAVDIGAGTGKFTEVLIHLGHSVIAVEPDTLMRNKLSCRLPTVRVVEGTAESLPLVDASCDVVTIAQAFHWMEHGKTLNECARILRPGGRLGIIWNKRDENTPWVKDFTTILSTHANPSTDVEPPVPAHHDFLPAEKDQFAFSHQLTPNEIVDLAASRSYVISMAEKERNLALDAVRRMVSTHPSIAGLDSIELPYVTSVFLLRRR